MNTQRVSSVALSAAAAVAFGSIVLVARAPAPSMKSVAAPGPPFESDDERLRNIAWSINPLHVVLSPGESASRSLTLTSTRNVDDLQLCVSAALIPYVKIQALTKSDNDDKAEDADKDRDNDKNEAGCQSDSFQLKANKPQFVDLLLSIPARTALGTYQGTVEIRRGKRTLQQTLDITLDSWRLFGDVSLDVSFHYPPDWLPWPQTVPNDPVTVSNVSPDSQVNPQSMVGACKIVFNRFQKSPDITLREWLDAETGGLPPTSVTAIAVNSLSGVQELGGESAPVSTVFLSLSETAILSVELLCGADRQPDGDIVFKTIVSTINIR